MVLMKMIAKGEMKTITNGEMKMITKGVMNTIENGIMKPTTKEEYVSDNKGGNENDSKRGQRKR